MPVRGSDYDIMAGFKCPICGSDVKAHGFYWGCVNKDRCGFRTGRSWKRDPKGDIWQPKYSAYENARARYKEAHGTLKVIYNLDSGKYEEQGEPGPTYKYYWLGDDGEPEKRGYEDLIFKSTFEAWNYAIQSGVHEDCCYTGNHEWLQLASAWEEIHSQCQICGLVRMRVN